MNLEEEVEDKEEKAGGRRRKMKLEGEKEE